MEALGRAIFIALNCVENCFSIARFYRPGTILEKFSDDPGISVMVPAAHRLKIWVQIRAQFSLLGAPSACLRYWGLPRIPRKSFVFHWPLASHGGSHRFESYSAHQINSLAALPHSLSTTWAQLLQAARNAQLCFSLCRRCRLYVSVSGDAHRLCLIRL
jgi:hypothetical protein